MGARVELHGHGPTPQRELFELSFEEEPGGARPDRLCEVRPKDRDLRRTVDQIVDAVPGLPALDVPVPQMVDQPLVLLAGFDVLVPEQVIEVPKIVLEMSLTAPQPSWECISERIVEQIVVIPGGGLQGSRPGQGSPASSSFQPTAASDDDADDPGEKDFSHMSPT